MLLRCRCCTILIILGILHRAQSNSKYKHEESNEEGKANFNVVSTLSGGTQSSRHHTRTNFDLSPAESNRPVSVPYPDLGYTRSYGGEKSHYGHNHVGGAACTEAFNDGGVEHEIDEPHGHERTGGITNANSLPTAGLKTDFGGQSSYGNLPLGNLGPPYQHTDYPLPTQGQYYPVNPQPVQSHIYPSLPQPNYPTSWPSQYPSNYPLPGQSQPYPAYPQSHLYPSLPIAPGQPQQQYPGHQPGYPMPYPTGLPPTTPLQAPSYGSNIRGYDHLDHTFTMNTEYKEDGVHSGPTNKLTGNGYGFGSGYGGGYNGAFNRPGY